MFWFGPTPRGGKRPESTPNGDFRMSVRLDAALGGKVSRQANAAQTKPAKTPAISTETRPGQTPHSTLERAARPIGYQPGPNTLLRPLGYRGGSTNM
jgi:hypothetical protein